MLKICLQHLRHKCKYASLAITLISASLIFQNISKCEKSVLRFSSYLLPLCLLGWLLTMLLHHTPSLENFLFHEILQGLSMLMNFCFIFPTSIFNWMSLPFDQVFKILFSLGLFANPLVNYSFHLWLLSYRHLFFPLNLFLFIFYSCFFSSIKVQIHNIEYR
jgi:hypothetical protein